MKTTRRVLNFTNRISIGMTHVHVVAINQDDQHGFVQLVNLDLADYKIPDGCPVVLEARTRIDGLMRLEIGVTPELDFSKRLAIHPHFFNSARVRIKILDALGSGQIVASVEDVDVELPETAGVRSLLPTLEVETLEHRLWRLRVDNDGFCLEVNKNFPLMGEVVRSSAFKAFVLPEALRQIALLILDETCPVPESYKNKWNRLFNSVYQDSQDLRETEPDVWADEAAEALSKRHSLIVEYQNSWRDEE